MYQHILVATDGSELSEQAVSEAAKLAVTIKAKLSVVYIRAVWQPGPYAFYPFPAGVIPSRDDHAHHTKLAATAALQKASAIAQTIGVQANSVDKEHEQVFRGLLEVAQEQNCDLICMASHGRRGIGALVLGSETQKLLSHSTLPVLVVR